MARSWMGKPKDPVETKQREWGISPRADKSSIGNNKKRAAFAAGVGFSLLPFLIPKNQYTVTGVWSAVFLCFGYTGWHLPWIERTRKRQITALLFVAATCIGLGKVWWPEDRSQLLFNAIATNIMYPDGKQIGDIEWKREYGQVDFNLTNSQEEAIQNLNVDIQVDSGVINRVGRYNDVAGLEFHRPELPSVLLRFKSTNKKTGEEGPAATFDLRNSIPNQLRTTLPSRQWTISCPRVNGKTSIRMVLATSAKSGIPDPGVISINGSYELIASEGSRVVRVNTSVRIVR
jgi:hypothetical protein